MTRSRRFLVLLLGSGLAGTLRADGPFRLLGVSAAQAAAVFPQRSAASGGSPVGNPSVELAGLAGASRALIQSDGLSGGQAIVVRKADFEGTDFQLHIHFSGDRGVLPAGAKTLAELITEVWTAHPDVIFVIPDGNGAGRGGDGRWRGVLDLGKLERDALATEPGGRSISRRIVSAHSGGAYAIGALLVYSLADPGVLMADRILLLDTPTDLIKARLRERIRRRAPRWAITYVDGRQSTFSKVSDAEREELGLERPVGGLFASGLESSDESLRHYQARDEYFGRYHD